MSSARMHPACWTLLLILLAAACGCAYRVEAPTRLDETIRIQVIADQAREPRFGAYLQQEVASALALRTGWRIRPDGSARLDLTIDTDRIDVQTTDARSIPSRWKYEMRGTALLVCKDGNRTTRFSGTGYASTRAEEPAALRAAAAAAADSLAVWLAAAK